MEARGKSLLYIHISVLLFGLTGLFGKSISLSAPFIVLGRVFFASLSMGLFFLVCKKNVRLASRGDYIILACLGALLACHWTAFYMSVKVSTVAIALLTFSSYPIFVTFLEPLFFHEKFKRADLAAALVMFCGVALIVPSFNIKDSMTVGLLWGMLGCATYAALSLLNRKFASRYDGSVIAFYEQAAAAFVLLPLLFVYRPSATASDWALLVLLGVVFTGVAHSMFIGGMKNIRAQTAGVIASLETLYGIAAAALVLAEIPSARELIGGALILGTAFISTALAAKER